ncbi:unnamed protein product [Ostreobium quekettii]|uniref:RBR-type E3 ubiquitin transferase n=1 Tax=Ostreobium quekettii TaxID=121088 RepID=A0A8S1INR5_9CHLO|nr:unnamed protein product [Ostreobium quekettii]
MWTENGEGLPVCFSWIEWIKACALECLGIKETLFFHCSTLDSSEGVDLRARGRNEVPIDTTVFEIHCFDEQRRIELFNQSAWTCPICMDVVSGRQCVRLPACQHFFCGDCFSEYCKVNVKEGAVDLKCPQHQCMVALEPHILRDSLHQDDYGRWETLTLQRALDRMKDVRYCPRCGTVCLEERGNFAQCPKCFFAFCINCKDSYHPGSACLTQEDKIEAMRKKAEGSGQGKSREDRVDRLLDLKMQAASITYIASNMRMCPVCKMWIQRSSGCNEMRCTNCRTRFCYMCGEQRIEGSKHSCFGGTCGLCGVLDARAGGIERAVKVALRQERETEPELGDYSLKRKRCPKCKRYTYKVD